MSNECVFCKIIKGELPSYKIYENEYVYAFLDISMDAIGHTLVVPKKHCVNALDADIDTYIEVQKAVKLIAEHYVRDCGYSGVNILNANGKDAQQTVFHYHVHIVPRKENDGINMWPENDKKELNMEGICNSLKI